MDLLETSKLMREQSNRLTQYPLFVVQEMVERAVPEGCGERIEIDDEGQEITPEDRDEYIADYGDDNLREVNVKREYEVNDRAGFFFTEKACHDHIEANYYHYNKPRSYVISAWRNPEVVQTMQMILKLTGDEIPSQYQ